MKEVCALHIVPRACGKFIDVELLRNSSVGARYQARISETRVHIYCGVFVVWVLSHGFVHVRTWCLGLSPQFRAVFTDTIGPINIRSSLRTGR